MTETDGDVFLFWYGNPWPYPIMSFTSLKYHHLQLCWWKNYILSAVFLKISQAQALSLEGQHSTTKEGPWAKRALPCPCAPAKNTGRVCVVSFFRVEMAFHGFVSWDCQITGKRWKILCANVAIAYTCTLWYSLAYIIAYHSSMAISLLLSFHLACCADCHQAATISRPYVQSSLLKAKDTYPQIACYTLLAVTTDTTYYPKDYALPKWPNDAKVD